MTRTFGVLYSRIEVKNTLAFLGIALLVAIAIFASMTGFQNVSRERQQKERIEKLYSSLPPLNQDSSSINTLVTGYKTQEFTMIEAVNDSGKNYTKVAMLPHNIKFVFPLRNAKQLLYIAETDSGDLGARLEVKDIGAGSGSKDGATHVIYTASDGYKIDRLTVSENNDWITWYEIKPPSGSDTYTHTSDLYRSFKASIADIVNGTSTGLVTWTKLTDQRGEPGTAIYLPSIITNNGEVYFDGIVVSDYGLYSGFVNESLETIIEKDNYNSKPYFYNQRYLVYTSFNPANNPKLTGGSSPAAREAVVNTNTVKVLDLSDPARKIITVGDGSDGEQYKHPVVVEGDPASAIIVAVEVYKIQESGVNKGKLGEKEIQLLKYSSSGVEKVRIIDVPKDKSYRILAIGALPNGEKTIMIGEETGTLGNLGTGWFVGVSGYQSTLSQILIYNLSRIEKIETIRPETAGYLEFIGELGKSQSSPLGINRNESIVELLPSLDAKGQQLQLATFVPVEPKRERTNPRADCINEWQQIGYQNLEACESCPIYVYSNNSQNIRVKMLTPISESTSSPVSINNEWNFVADNLGNLLMPDSSVFNKIDFLFPRGYIDEPDYGIVLENSEFEEGIKNYAKELGFEGREINDIANDILPQVGEAKYLLISHLEKPSVEKLLDFEISPQPQVKINHLFYVKKFNERPSKAYQEPQFIKALRLPFTVVSWGAIVE